MKQCNAEEKPRSLSLGEQERSDLSARLRLAFLNPEDLAEWLHKQYRAAFKAMHSGRGSMMGVGRVVSKSGTGCHNEHDHGWSACHKKEYFRRRARYELRGTGSR